MHSFRKKVFLSYVLLLFLFLTLMVPCVTNSVQQIVLRSMNDCADELVKDLCNAESDEDLVQMLQDRKRHLFYRVGILDAERRLLYDSHTRRLVGTPSFPLQFVTHPEIEEAIRFGSGHSEEYSHLLGQKLVYVAKQFDFHGKPYILRIAFPFQYIQELRDGFTLGFLLFGAMVLILFSALAAIVLNHFSSPIRKITAAIRNYKEGNLATLPEIQLKASPQDEFSHLANTLNSLSLRVKREIELVTYERNEREAILESLEEGVIALDRELNISYINQTALQFLQLNYPVIGMIAPERCLQIARRCQQEHQLLSDDAELRGGPNKVFLSLSAIPRPNGGVLLVVHDKSVQYRMLEMRKAFIANASHELKTPITIIRGYAETFHDNLDLPSTTIQEITSKIVENCKRMTTIIKNLLTIADIENLPSFRVCPHSLPDIVQTCVSTISPLWPDASFEIQHDSNKKYMIEIDRSLLEIAINNLVDNGLKYSPRSPKIEIILGETEEHISLQVRDNGMGIPENELSRIFQRFYRVDKARSIQLGGSGLGLSIVETIVEKHLGTISVESCLDQGSTFTIKLPKELQKKLTLLENHNQ
jgi:two-component system, OmpR family, phosphate regulon sensor histidine kinase PhoR